MKYIISLSEVTQLVHDDELYSSKVRALKNQINTDTRSLSEVAELFPGSKTKMTMGNMYTMLSLMKLYNSFKEIPITREDILDDYSDVGSHSNFYDRAIHKLHETYDDSHAKVMQAMEDITHSINDPAIFAAKNVLLKTTPTVSIRDIMDIGKRYPEFYDIMNFTHAENTDHLNNMSDKIKKQDENNSRSVEIIKKDKQNQFRKLLESGGGVNINQMGEVLNMIGYKPDIRGRVVPKPIDSSFFRGLKGIEDFYTDALGARKALNTSKLQVRQSGYLNRKISILTEDVRIEPEVKCCDSKHWMPLKISSHDMFKLVIGRYHVVEGKDIIIDKDDTYLIGATIKLRSPITCALKGEKVCMRCYGELALVNLNLNVGTIANLIFTEPMTQKLLSTKHLLKVDVNIRWDDLFFKYFIIDGNIVSPKDPELEVFVHSKDLIINEGYTTNRYRTKRFFVKDEEGERVYLDSPVSLLIPDTEIEDIEDFYTDEDEVYRFTIFDLNTLDFMFTVVIPNTGVADPLLEMKAGIDKNYKMNTLHQQNIYTYFQDLMDLLIKSHTYVMSVHIEVILSCMTKFHDRSVLSEDINLLEEDIELSTEDQVYRKYYRIYNINDAIYHSGSPVKALMYQQTIKQLTTDSFNDLFGKRENSEFDRMFIN